MLNCISQRLLIEQFFRDRLDLDPSWINQISLETRHGVTLAYLNVADPKAPNLFTIAPTGRNGDGVLIAYHEINAWADRQMVSYFLGSGLANLAEVKEIDGRLYSKSCVCHRPEDLPHQGPEQSKIGLWIHDCLTEDMDHRHDLNRKSLSDGTCISFDFGLAFSSRYYPPFYTFELGILETELKKHEVFILKVLSDYASKVLADEETLIKRYKRTYPKTHRESTCRLYLRNFKTYFPKRIHRCAFFQKLKGAPFDSAELKEIAAAVGLSLAGITNWQQLSEALAALNPPTIDLRGLDLSGADLRRSCLCGADLREADITQCRLSETDLRNADLRGARIEGADFTRAKLEGARFS